MSQICASSTRSTHPPPSMKYRIFVPSPWGQGLARRNTFVCRGMREEYTFYNRDDGLGLSQTDSGVPVFRRACAGSSAEDRARQDRDELQLRHGYSSTRGRSGPVTFSLAVSLQRRARWSSWSVVILIRLRRRSGFRAAVKVDRSMASNEATAPMAGASGRFKDTISENCPFVRPSGRCALSKHRASARAARST